MKDKLEQAEEVAEHINLILGVNVYENKRTLPLVDARSMYCYILRKDFGYTLFEIRDSLRVNGKKFDHCTVLHNVGIWEEVSKRRKDFNSIRMEILGKVEPKKTIISYIQNITDIEKINVIYNYIKEL
jgi:chromosomal replication initiation ATPase DnaA